MARQQKRVRSRGEKRAFRRRIRRLWFIGTCSNCGAKETGVRHIAGAQVCYQCGKHLPGHLLRLFFPTFGKLYTPEEARALGAGVEAQDLPAIPRRLTWKEKLGAIDDRVRRFIA